MLRRRYSIPKNKQGRCAAPSAAAFFQSPDDEWPGHLLTPTQHKIGVVEGTRFQIAGSCRRFNCLAVQPVTNQFEISFANTNRSRGDASEDEPALFDSPIRREVEAG